MLIKFLIPTLLVASCATARPDPGLMAAGLSSLHWEATELPLTVLISPDLPDEAVRTLNQAVNSLNASIGRAVFLTPTPASTAIETRVEVMQLQPPRGTIYVYEADGSYDCRGSAGQLYSPDGTITSSRVRFPRSGGENLMIHELGHVLGLAHDTDPASIMNHFVAGPQKLTENDLAILRTTYLK